MPVNCENFKDELVSLVYEGEPPPPALKEHLTQCGECSQALEGYQKVHTLFQALPEANPPAHLTDALFDRFDKPQKKWSLAFLWQRIMLHPASVAAIVFVLTLGGTLLYRKYVPTTSQTTGIAFKESASTSGMGSPPMTFVPRVFQPSPARYGSNIRMVDWNPMPRLIPDLDRPVLRHTDPTSLEQASLESIATFKHNIALRHILDGDLAKADQILDNIAENYLNYSNWEQAVLLHMQLMKRLGRSDDFKRDIARLKEYAMSSPMVISQIENEFR